jgi:hypothetical protein
MNTNTKEISMAKFTQGQRVYFDLGNGQHEGWATVHGHQGFVIIIKPEKKIKGYDFSHMYIVDSQVSTSPPTKKEDAKKEEVKEEVKEEKKDVQSPDRLT